MSAHLLNKKYSKHGQYSIGHALLCLAHSRLRLWVTGKGFDWQFFFQMRFGTSSKAKSIFCTIQKLSINRQKLYPVPADHRHDRFDHSTNTRSIISITFSLDLHCHTLHSADIFQRQHHRRFKSTHRIRSNFQ